MHSSDRADRVRRALDGLKEDEPSGPAGAPPGLDRFEILSRLGQGASAVVFLARDRKLGREVALKVLRDPLGDDASVRERFEREAKVAASLTHPNIVAVHDVGEAEGRLYLVMERIDGRPLAAVFEEPGVLRTIVGLLEQAARGAGAAHAKGVVHRDLKPANILVTRDGVAKVADFGLAHVAGAEAGITRSGAVLGTPLYMAPEQVRGRSGAIAPQTDVYALGAMLYQALAGRPPHVGDSVTEIYGKIVAEDPADPRRLNPQAPRDLETIALKALDKDPVRRYPDGAAFAGDLARYLAGEPIAARPQSAAKRFWRRASRRRAVLVPTAAAIVLAAALGAWGLAAYRGRQRVSESRRLIEEARTALDLAQRDLYRAGADFTRTLARVDESRRSIERAVALDPESPTGHDLLGRAWELLGWEEKAEPCWRRAISIDPSCGPAHYHLARLLITRAFFRIVVGTTDEMPARRQAAAPLLREALVELEASASLPNAFDGEVEREVASVLRAYASDDPKLEGILRAALDRHGRDAGAEELWWMAALSIRREETPSFLDRALELRPNYWLALYTRGCSRSAKGDPAGAAEDHGRALEIHPRQAPLHAARGEALEDAGRPQEAIEAYSRAIELDPGSIYVRKERSRLRYSQGDLDGALADADELIHRNPGDIEAIINRGQAWKKKGELPRAAADFQRARDLIAPGTELRRTVEALLRGVQEEH